MGQDDDEEEADAEESDKSKSEIHDDEEDEDEVRCSRLFSGFFHGWEPMEGRGDICVCS